MKAGHSPSRFIRTAKIPSWMALRDVVITLVAWMIIAYFLRRGLYLTYDYLRYPYFELVNAKAPNWPLIWLDLRKFVIFAVCMVLWLTFWAIYSRKKLRKSSMVPQPAPLSLHKHAISVGLSDEQLAGCKSSVITTVFFDPQRRVTELLLQGKEPRGAAVEN